MPPAKVRPGIRILQSVGLTILLVTVLLLGSLVVSFLFAGIGNMQRGAAAVSTALGAVACVVMLVDLVDLWMRGRRMTAYSVKMMRSLVFVVLLAAGATSLLGRNAALFLIMAPALVTYFIAARERATGMQESGSSQTAGSRRGPAGRSRQRRGGKKRK